MASAAVDGFGSRQAGRRRPIAVALMILIVVAIAGAWRWGRAVTYRPQNPVVTLPAKAQSLTATGNRVMVTQQDGWRLQVSEVDAVSGVMSRPRSADLAGLTSRALRETEKQPPAADRRLVYPGTSIEQRRPQLYRKAPVQQSSDAPASVWSVTPAVALGPDGSRAAWVAANYLVTARLDDPNSVRVSRLARSGCAPLLGNDLLALGCGDNVLELRDTGGRTLIGTNQGTAPWTIAAARGSIVAISGRDLLVWRTARRSERRLVTDFRGVPRAIALASTGELALASQDGYVSVVSSTGRSDRLSAPGIVDAVTFFEDGQILVAGAFRGIYSLRRDADPAILIPDVIGTRFLAHILGGRVAYAAADRTSVVALAATMRFTGAGYGLLSLAVVLCLPLFVFLRPPAHRAAAVPLPGAAPVTTPSFTLPPPDPPSGLVRACLAQECVLYAGAGMSAQAGYPTWKPFVETLLTWGTDTARIDRPFGDSLRAALAAGQIDPVADALVSAVGRSEVLKQLDEAFGREHSIPQAHRVLKQIPFCAALTTNFDTLLERTYPDAVGHVFTPREAERIVELLGRRQFFIAKLYGSLSDPESVLVAPAEYAEAISRNLPFSQCMEGLFVSRTLLFVGASMEGIEAYLSGLTFRGQMTRPHYAVVTVTDAGWRAKADLLKRRYGIEVLPLTPTASFKEVPEFLERLAAAVAAAQEPNVAAHPTATEGLTRLRLQNIGPFPELTLELQRDWNVILGDNGIGKSSILKAIAACFCGRDAAPYAARLIRSGEMSGSIVLETARNTYRMELRRKNGGADVSIVPARPLEVEGALALGFPPLRAVTWDRSKGPTGEGQRRPAVEDLLPIVKAEPDPRLDKLKQWIVNLDSRINYERSHGGDDRYERLLERFFEIVDRVTPGMPIRFGRVNPDTREVTVITDDGEIPIEMISQGSVSLMGWIGVLLQRLYEVYGDDADPTARYALVLIDEIDAHMHPEWQQSIVEGMTMIFPNVQYVATTHSPLVVGGMDARQVIRYVRNGHGRVSRVEVTDEMLVGRADQILTGKLFGMKTTLDQQTQRAMDRYKVLLGTEARGPEEDEEFRRLHRELKFKIPLAEETAPERKALALVEAIVNDQLGTVLPQVRQPVLDKARDLLKELSPDERVAR